MGDHVKNGKNSDGSGWLQGGSSNINEAIRGVLNFFFFFKKMSDALKATKVLKALKAPKAPKGIKTLRQKHKTRMSE